MHPGGYISSRDTIINGYDSSAYHYYTGQGLLQQIESYNMYKYYISYDPYEIQGNKLLLLL